MAAVIKRYLSFKTFKAPTGWLGPNVSIKPVEGGSEVNKVPEIKIENCWISG